MNIFKHQHLAISLCISVFFPTVASASSRLDPSWPYEKQEKTLQEQRNRHFKGSDKNKDEKLTEEEFGVAFREISMLSKMAASSATADQLKKLKQNPLPVKTAGQFFKNADKDKSGSLSKAEFDATFMAIVIQEKAQYAALKDAVREPIRKPAPIKGLRLAEPS